MGGDWNKPSTTMGTFAKHVEHSSKVARRHWGEALQRMTPTGRQYGQKKTRRNGLTGLKSSMRANQ